MKIVTVVGARPQFIKASAVSRALRRLEGSKAVLEEVIVHTGQHHDDNMSGAFFRQLDIPEPQYNLGIGGLPHGALTGRMLEGIESILQGIRPVAVLVYGDTDSTLAGALAASKLHIPVAHVEAGLRSFNRMMPEEINRVLTDHVSDLLFCPTTTAASNLANEGVHNGVHVVGDVMYDVALHYGKLARERSSILQSLNISPGGYVLATVHRQENTDLPSRLAGILQGLRRVAIHLPVVMPLHPRTRGAVSTLGLDHLLDGIQVIDPCPYLDMVSLEANAAAIYTDSGGVQKEAFFYRVPCVTLRAETEWVETVELGWNHLADADPERIDESVAWALARREPATRWCGEADSGPYGDGHAAEAIVRTLAESFPQTSRWIVDARG